MLRIPLTGAALAVLLAGSAGLALAAGPADDDQDFVNQAAPAGVAEVTFGQLATDRAESQDVKDFAQRMVTDHTAANEKLTQIAQAAGLTVPTEMDQAHQDTLMQLTGLTGAEFDKAYIQSQLADHQAAVNLFSNQAAQAPAGQVEGFAAETLPTLQEHLSMVEQIGSGMGLQGATPPAQQGQQGQPAATETQSAPAGQASQSNDAEQQSQEGTATTTQPDQQTQQ